MYFRKSKVYIILCFVILIQPCHVINQSNIELNDLIVSVFDLLGLFKV